MFRSNFKSNANQIAERRPERVASRVLKLKRDNRNRLYRIDSTENQSIKYAGYTGLIIDSQSVAVVSC